MGNKSLLKGQNWRKEKANGRHINYKEESEDLVERVWAEERATWAKRCGGTTGRA